MRTFSYISPVCPTIFSTYVLGLSVCLFPGSRETFIGSYLCHKIALKLHCIIRFAECDMGEIQNALTIKIM